MDLVYGMALGQINHDSRIDWLEMNETSKHLLFRDKRQRLMLVNVATLQKLPILNYATFVQVRGQGKTYIFRVNVSDILNDNK